MKSIKHKKVDWDNDHSRIILYADIMGFKAKLKSVDHANVVNELRRFVKAVSSHLSPYQTGGHLRMTLFSDLIVVAADQATIPNFKLIVHAAAALMQECHDFKYPINGCIACGPLAFDEAQPIIINAAVNDLPNENDHNNVNGMKNGRLGRKGQYMPLFVGQSVVDAYLLTEDLFCYGLVLHPSAENILSQTNNSFPNNQLPFKECPIPLKSGGHAELQYLDWSKVKLAKNTTPLSDVVSYLTNLKGSVGSRPRAYIFNTLNVLSKL